MKTDLTVKAAIFLRAAELVEQGHCKAAQARKSNGAYCEVGDPAAVSFCLIGAIRKAEIEVFGTDAHNYWWNCAFEHLSTGRQPWAHFNNDRETTAAMVAERLRLKAFE